MPYPIKTGMDAVTNDGLTGEDLEEAGQLKFLDRAMAPFLDIVLKAGSVEVTPVVYATLSDPDTDLMFRRHLEQVLRWPVQPKYMVVLGQHEAAGNRPRLTSEHLQGLVPSDSHIAVVSQGAADHTPGQTNWLADLCRELGLATLATSVHDSHGARARGTLLKSLIKTGLDRQVAMLPWARPFNPVAPLPITVDFADEPRTDFQLAYRETWAIMKYTQQGSVATTEEMTTYLQWLFSGSVLAESLSEYTAS